MGMTLTYRQTLRCRFDTEQYLTLPRVNYYFIPFFVKEKKNFKGRHAWKNIRTKSDRMGNSKGVRK